MKTAIRITTLVMAATALAGCQSFNDFFAFKQKRVEQPVSTASVFGSEELEQGRMALKAGYPARAIEQFRLAALNEEVAPDAFNGMAVAYARLGRADLAERYFKTAMTLDSSNVRFAANLANFYDSPLGQSQRALAMREAEAAEMLAATEKAAISEGLLEAPAPVTRIGAITLENAKPLEVTRGLNRELKLATSTSVAESGGNLAAVSSRKSAPAKTATPVTQALEQATADAVAKKRNPTVISLLGIGQQVDGPAARITLTKPGSQGATRPRTRSYPIRVKLTSRNPK